MSQQIFIVPGGNAFNSYEEYFANLQAKTVDLARIKQRGWRQGLGERLGDGFEVVNLTMPNAQNAKYAEWKIYFEKIIPLMDDNIVLIGPSLGGIFLAKFLSEETFPKKIRATFLIAAPFNTAIQHPLADFVLEGDLAKFNQQAGEVFLYHSKDDVVVPFTNLKSYQNAIPAAHVRTFDNKGHFNEEGFAELEEDLQALVI